MRSLRWGIVLAVLVAASAGTAQAQPRVIGGYYPSGDLLPWVTSIESRTGMCTASLVAPDRVLTAAHCLTRDLAPSSWTVRVGVRNRANPNEGETRSVTGIAPHPKLYLPESGVHAHHGFYDIAVMFLDRPVSIAPAPLGTEANWGTWGTALGWGHYNPDHENQVSDPRVKAINLSLGTDSQCGAWINEDGVTHYFPTIHICAYDYHGDDCISHGDSGGPLTVDGVLIGVTSFFPLRSGWGPCGLNSMTGFAWVAGAEMRDWVLTVPNPSVVAGPIPTPVPPPPPPDPACGKAQRQLSATAAKLAGAQRKLQRASTVRQSRRARRKVRTTARHKRAARARVAAACGS